MRFGFNRAFIGGRDGIINRVPVEKVIENLTKNYPKNERGKVSVVKESLNSELEMILRCLNLPFNLLESDFYRVRRKESFGVKCDSYLLVRDNGVFLGDSWIGDENVVFSTCAYRCGNLLTLKSRSGILYDDMDKNKGVGGGGHNVELPEQYNPDEFFTKGPKRFMDGDEALKQLLLTSEFNGRILAGKKF